MLDELLNELVKEIEISKNKEMLTSIVRGLLLIADDKRKLETLEIVVAAWIKS